VSSSSIHADSVSDGRFTCGPVLLPTFIAIHTNLARTKLPTPELPPTRPRLRSHKLIFFYVPAPDENVKRDIVVVNDEASRCANFSRPKHGPDNVDAACGPHLLSRGGDEGGDVFFSTEGLLLLAQKAERD